jgi:hypothetical protein
MRYVICCIPRRLCDGLIPNAVGLTVMALEVTPEHESHDGFPHPPPLQLYTRL